MVGQMKFQMFFIECLLSWCSVLFVEETGVPGEPHKPVAGHEQTLSHNVAHLALVEIRAHNICVDGH